MNEQTFAPFFDANRIGQLLAPYLESSLGAWAATARCTVHHVWREIPVRLASRRRPSLGVVYAFEADADAATSKPSQVHILHGRVTLTADDPAAHDRQPEACDALQLQVGDATLTLHRFPHDARMPQLARLAAGEAACDAMPRAARLHLASPAPHVVVRAYRPGERCTFSYANPPRTHRDTLAPTIFAKTYADDSAIRVASRLDAVARAVAHGSMLTVPDVLGVDADMRTVWTRGLFGEPTVVEAREYAWALAELHAAPLDAGAVFSRRQRLDEAARKAAKLARLWPGFATTLSDIIRGCEGLLTELPPERGEPRHGDVHLRQCVRIGRRVALFDFDELAHGDLEQDLGALAVELEDAAQPTDGSHEPVAAIVAAYNGCPRRVRAPDPRTLDFHYRLQRLDRAYRNLRRGLDDEARVGRSVLLAARGLAPQHEVLCA